MALIVVYQTERNLLETSDKDLLDTLHDKDRHEHELEYRWKYYQRQFKHFEDAANKLLAQLLKEEKHDEYVTYRQDRQTAINKYMKYEILVSKVDPSIFAGCTQAGPVPPDSSLRLTLPKRELPQFSGDVREWLSFSALFKEVDNDKALSEIDKFHFLLQSTKENSAARKLLQSFPFSASNYVPALTALKERFGRPNVLIKVYVRDLLQLVIEASTGKTLEFGELVTTLNSQLRNLESLGVTQDKCAEVLYPVVECCLPAEILQAWQRSPKFNEKLSDLIDFLQSEVNNYTERSLAHFQFNSGNNRGNKQEKSDKVGNSNKPIKTTTGFMNTTETKADPTCVFCGKNNHSSTDCFKAGRWDLDKRKEVLKEANACYKCFKTSHGSKNCKAKLVCSMCSKGHHVLMCHGKERQGAPPQTQQSKETIINTNTEPQKQSDEKSPRVDMSNFISRPDVLYQTLTVWIHGPKGSRQARAAFDSLSQSSYIKEDVAKKLALPIIGHEKVAHQTFGGGTTDVQKHNVHVVTVSGLHEKKKYKLEMAAIKKISSAIEPLPCVGTYREECIRRGITLTDLESLADDLEVIIGADYGDDLKEGSSNLKLGSGPVAVKTKLGWVVSGRLNNSDNKRNSIAFLHLKASLDKEVNSLWALETIGIEDSATTKNREELEKGAMQHFNETVTRDTEGRYCVHLPWIEGHPVLPDNEFVAKRRLQTLTKQLKKDNMLEAYNDVFKNWLHENIIEKAEDENHQLCHYLPHRAVIKEGSTTPLRPVFDASAHSRNHPSLNDCLEKGPNLLTLIPEVLNRFRMNKIGVTADIKRAFQQMSVRDKDRDFMRFLWWEDIPHCTKLAVYRHARVVFGVSSSPFLLGATLQHHISHYPGHTETKQMLLESMYVDNSVYSLNSTAAAGRFKKESCKILQDGRFDLRGWEMGPNAKGGTVSVLGFLWNTQQDILQFDTSHLLSNLEATATKRNLYKLMNMLFDPLGLAAPFTVVAKILLKRVTEEEKLDWDSPLPFERGLELEKWKMQLKYLHQIQIPRHIFAGEMNSDMSIHCYCDASTHCFATCIYLRVETDAQVRVSLIQAKTRVSPKKPVTIPRLELLACVIGARLTSSVLKTMKLSVPVFYWSDSTTALTWIQRQEAWATFVQNRVTTIRALSEPEHWRHIPGVHNPADLPSRGCTLKKMLESSWLTGPAWLYKPEHEWPNSVLSPDEEEVYSEKRKAVITSLNLVGDDEFSKNCLRIGSYYRIIRVLALVHKFVERSRGFIKRGALSVDDIAKAEKSLIYFIQKHWRENKQIKKFSVFMDGDGLLRVKSRLTLGEEEDDFKYPLLLPGSNAIVRHLILYTHKKQCHAGVQYLQAHLREKYWITNSRRTIGNVIHSCSVCRRHIATRCNVPIPPLPATRINSTKVFSVTGVDVTGPLFVEKGKKVWVALFTCAVYRAMHLELLDSMSTEAFLEAFRKFVARRGRPTTVYSDNGTNFVGASNLLKSVDWEKVEEYGTFSQIQWRFNPPTAAWWGGWWERLIGLVKGLLRRVLGSRYVKRNQLEVLLFEVEAVMNDRPLTYIGEQTGDLRPLTPSCFLKDLQGSSLPELEVVDGKPFRMNFTKMQKRKEELRERFKKEYLGLLVNVGSGKKPTLVTTGSVVLVEMDNSKRIDWPMGVILETIPGADGHARVAKVKTTRGILVRPLQRLFPLEVPTTEHVDRETQDA